ncbi:hypothetical protein [Cyclobacterium sp. 1_MG-2023]|nr:hypothetical protein [Cyclobacterium sp. 1_MG-2023]
MIAERETLKRPEHSDGPSKSPGVWAKVPINSLFDRFNVSTTGSVTT